MIPVIKIELIDEYIKEHKITLTQFCKISKIAPSTIKCMRENRGFNSIAIFKLAKTLNLDACQVVNANHDDLVE